jgi:Ran GTPase-activating protein (RanGAP) involved in mRNA processing and transport
MPAPRVAQLLAKVPAKLRGAADWKRALRIEEDEPEVLQAHLGRDEFGVGTALEILDAEPFRGFRVAMNLPFRGLTATSIGPLLKSPVAERIEHLDLVGNKLKDAGVAVIAAAGTLGNLVSLTLDQNGVGPEGAEALAGSTSLAKLEVLSLHANAIGKRGCAALGRAANPSLSSLRVGMNGLGPDEMARLLGGTLIKRLRRLGLRGNSSHQGDRDPAPAALVAKAPASALVDLDLDYLDIGDDGIARLAASKTLPPLEALELGRNGATAHGFAVLASGDLFRELRSLSYMGNHVPRFDKSSWLAPLARAFPKLQRLDVSSSSLADEDLLFLARAKLPFRLGALDLKDNPFTPNGLEALGASERLSQLSSLNLSCCALVELSVATFAKLWHRSLRQLDLSLTDADPERVTDIFSKVHFPELRALHLRGIKMDERKTRAILKSGNLPRLQLLNLDSTEVRAPAVPALMKAAGNDDLRIVPSRL